jgi:hypothetical protein
VWDGAGDRVLDPLDPEQTGSRQRVTSALTFWPTEFSRLRAQGAVDLPSFRDGPDLSAFLALEVLVGTHGAHSF